MRAGRPSSPCMQAPHTVALLFPTPGRPDFLQRGRHVLRCRLPKMFSWPSRLDFLQSFLQRGLRGGQAGNRDAEGGATDVAQAEAMTELHARWFTPVFAANAELNAGAALAAQGAGHLHELADAGLVDAREWILFHDLQFGVSAEEPAGVVAAHAQRRLRQIVGAEAEKLGLPGDFVRD